MKMYILLSFLLPFNVSADVVLLGNQKQILNFISETTSNENITPYALAYIEYRKSTVKEKAIRDLYEYAEFEHYSGNTDSADKTLSQIIDKCDSKILSPAVEELYLKTLTLKATIAPSHQHKVFWLNRAYLYNPEFNLKNHNYPAEILKIWQYVKENSKLTQIKVTPALRKFEYLVINSKVLNLYKYQTLKWPQGTVDYALISSHYSPLSGQIHFDKLTEINTNSKPLVNGDCLKHKISNKVIKQLASKIYFDDLCVVNTSDTHTMGLKHLTTLTPVESQNTNHKLKYKNRKASIFKNKWFWIAIGGLAVYQNSNTNPQPKNSASENTQVILP